MTKAASRSGEKKTKKATLSLPLDQETWEEVVRRVAPMRLTKTAVAEAAIHAALKAIQDSDGRIVFPIEFRVAYVPTPNPAPSVLTDLGNHPRPA